MKGTICYGNHGLLQLECILSPELLLNCYLVKNGTISHHCLTEAKGPNDLKKIFGFHQPQLE